jgi:hypothetical protein
MLDPDVRRELRSLTRETADLVARHLVLTGRLLDDEPERALAHGRAARAMAGRIGVVREAAGLAAYAAGEWNEAIADLRAARRITGQAGHLAVLADCERALGRPERALSLADDPAVPSLDQQERVELVIVLSGARRDLGQVDAAVLALQDPARRTSASRPWAARLWYAYADALLHAGRTDDARSGSTRSSRWTPTGRPMPATACSSWTASCWRTSPTTSRTAVGCPTRRWRRTSLRCSPGPSPRRRRRSPSKRPSSARRSARRRVDAVDGARPDAVRRPGTGVRSTGRPEDEGTSRPVSGPALLPVFASPPDHSSRSDEDDEGR